ncbi:MAG: plastocyanin/azurin family copper-binding protein [Actinomycetota bacterium]
MARRLPLLLLLLGASLVGLPPAAAGGGCHAGPDADLTSSTDRKVAIAECQFAATVTYVRPGDTVTWTSKDEVPHTVTGVAYSWGSREYLDRGDNVAYAFEDEGVYPYYCELHPSMVGAVVVGDARAMLGAAAGKVEAVDLAAAVPVTDTSSDEAAGDGLVIGLVAIVAGAAVAAGAWRTAIKRRSRAASSAA